MNEDGGSLSCSFTCRKVDRREALSAMASLSALSHSSRSSAELRGRRGEEKHDNLASWQEEEGVEHMSRDRGVPRFYLLKEGRGGRRVMLMPMVDTYIVLVYFKVFTDNQRPDKRCSRKYSMHHREIGWFPPSLFNGYAVRPPLAAVTRAPPSNRCLHEKGES